jgi:hypothetical protein
MQWNQLVGISYYANLEKFSDVTPSFLESFTYPHSSELKEDNL